MPSVRLISQLCGDYVEELGGGEVRWRWRRWGGKLPLLSHSNMLLIQQRAAAAGAAAAKRCIILPAVNKLLVLIPNQPP